MFVKTALVADFRAILLLSLLLCVLTAGVSSLSISGFGVPPTVPVDESVELNCEYQLKAGERESDLIVKWWWRPLLADDEDTARQLYQRIGRNKPQAVRSNVSVKENDTIIISNMQPQDSGTYECEVSEFAGSEDRRHQSLVVYSQGSGPQLNVSVVEDGEDTDAEDTDAEDLDVLVECSAEEVAPTPELAITVDGKPIKIVQWVSEPYMGYYNVSANATLSKEKAHGAEIKCELFFTDETISHPAYDDIVVYQVPGAEPVEEDVSEPAPSEDVTDATDSPAQQTDGASCMFASTISLLSVLLTMQYYF